MPPASTRRFLDVEELASRRVVLVGFVEPESMPRLIEVVTRTPCSFAYRIEFTRDASRRPRVIGRVEGMLPLICQRCLDNLDWRFDARFESLVIGDVHEETNGQDAVLCPGGRIALESMIEDELLLALPNAPVHAHGSCEAPPAQTANGQGPAQRSNPFAALHALRSYHSRERSN